MALVEATVAKAADCVDNFKKLRQRNCVLLLLETEEYIVTVIVARSDLITML